MVLALLLASCQKKEEVDILVYNGSIYTVDDEFSTVEAMVSSKGKIVETGTFKDLSARYSAARQIDLEGKAVFPGFIDSHCHFMGYARSMKSVNLIGTTSFQEVIDRVVGFQNEEGLDFIYGRGWDQNDWENTDFPDRSMLDSLYPNIPVVLVRIDGHAALVNGAVIAQSGLDTINNVDGGEIHRDDNGDPTGILIDNAVDIVEVPDLKRNALVEVLKMAERNCFEVGLTTLDDAGLGRGDIEVLDSLQQNGDLKMRIYAMVSDKPELLDYYLERGKIKTDRLHVGSFKFYGDGALGSRGACLLQPYHDMSDHYGLLLSSPEHFERSAFRLAENGWQMNTHAIGDSANRLLLGIYGAATASVDDHRWRIEHAQVLNEKDMDLFADYNVIPSVQPTHATSDMYWAEDRLGADRVEHAYAYKRLLEQYGKVALGTDFPVEDISPIKTFYAAVVRKDASNYPPEGFQVQDALSREEAIRGMTIWGAFANFEEKEKGSLEAGKVADFVILDRDLMKVDESELLGTKVLHTFLGGEEVYTRE